jgi:hypothetical protein
MICCVVAAPIVYFENKSYYATTIAWVNYYEMAEITPLLKHYIEKELSVHPISEDNKRRTMEMLSSIHWFYIEIKDTHGKTVLTKAIDGDNHKRKKPFVYVPDIKKMRYIRTNNGYTIGISPRIYEHWTSTLRRYFIYLGTMNYHYLLLDGEFRQIFVFHFVTSLLLFCFLLMATALYYKRLFVGTLKYYEDTNNEAIR